MASRLGSIRRPSAGWRVWVPLLLMGLAGLVHPGGAAADGMGEFVCGTPLMEDVLSAQPPGRVPERAPGGPGGGGGKRASACLTPEHIFLFEDSEGILMDPDHTGQDLLDLKVEAANQVIALHGDAFDFIGYWTDFEPARRFGGAHYGSVRNDVEGIGRPLYDQHEAIGLDGQRVQGLVMMYNFHLKDHRVAPGALIHEFCHQWMAFLAPMPDGRSWGGGHFTCRVDNQGGIHVSEWLGSDPARPRSARLNLDTGTDLGYLPLYLMGYVSAEELDVGSSEQRYMDDLDQPAGECMERYYGPVSTWSSADIIGGNGPRVPDASASQKHFKSAWVLIHQPGEPPSKSHVMKALRLLEGLGDDWAVTTLGRGTMDNSLFPDCNCNGAPDADDIASGASLDADGNGVPDECE